MLATRACNSYFTLLLCPWPHFQSSPLLYVGRKAIQQLVLWGNSTSQSQGLTQAKIVDNLSGISMSVYQIGVIVACKWSGKSARYMN